jgi:hypothetical protein
VDEEEEVEEEEEEDKEDEEDDKVMGEEEGKGEDEMDMMVVDAFASAFQRSCKKRARNLVCACALVKAKYLAQKCCSLPCTACLYGLSLGHFCLCSNAISNGSYFS